MNYREHSDSDEKSIISKINGKQTIIFWLKDKIYLFVPC